MTELNCWKETKYSEDKKRWYYVNKESNISQWGTPTKEILPAGWEYYESRSGNKPFYFNVFQKYTQLNKPLESQKRPVPNGWKEMRSKQCNNVYYKNLSTNETQWAYPEIEQPSTRGMIEDEFPSTRGMIEEESEEEFPFPPPQPAKLRRDSANIIKAALRRKFAQKDYDAKLEATKTVEAALRRKFAQKDYNAKLEAAHTIQRAVQHRNDKLMKERDIQAKRKRIFGELKKSIEHDDKVKATRKFQAAVRRKLAETTYDDKMKEASTSEAASTIEAAVRRKLAKKDYDAKIGAASTLEAALRRKFAEQRRTVANDEEEDPYLSAEEEIVSDDDDGYVSSDPVLRERKYDEYGIGKNAVRVYDYDE
uniref:WW domain-containing protein n=1 Tax=viral metagenome TaxID=1070528 RepID=A0A6C0H3P2_9ZZZZ